MLSRAATLLKIFNVLHAAFALPMKAEDNVVPDKKAAVSKTPSSSVNPSLPRYLYNVNPWDLSDFSLSPSLLMDPEFDTPYQKSSHSSHGGSSGSVLPVRTVNLPHDFDGNLIWVPTVPILTPSGRLYAGWYDKADPSDKATITKYLNLVWLYPRDASGLAQTRQRMRERIGIEEAKVLKNWQMYPNESHAIAMSTISKQKDPTNTLNTPRGRYLFETLMQEHKMGSVTAGDSVRFAFEVDKLGYLEDKEIIDIILARYQSNKVRGKKKIN